MNLSKRLGAGGGRLVCGRSTEPLAVVSASYTAAERGHPGRLELVALWEGDRAIPRAPGARETTTRRSMSDRGGFVTQSDCFIDSGGCLRERFLERLVGLTPSQWNHALGVARAERYAHAVEAAFGAAAAAGRSEAWFGASGRTGAFVVTGLANSEAGVPLEEAWGVASVAAAALATRDSLPNELFVTLYSPFSEAIPQQNQGDRKTAEPGGDSRGIVERFARKLERLTADQWRRLVGIRLDEEEADDADQWAWVTTADQAVCAAAAARAEPDGVAVSMSALAEAFGRLNQVSASSASNNGSKPDAVGMAARLAIVAQTNCSLLPEDAALLRKPVASVLPGAFPTPDADLAQPRWPASPPSQDMSTASVDSLITSLELLTPVQRKQVVDGMAGLELAVLSAVNVASVAAIGLTVRERLAADQVAALYAPFEETIPMQCLEAVD